MVLTIMWPRTLLAHAKLAKDQVYRPDIHGKNLRRLIMSETHLLWRESGVQQIPFLLRMEWIRCRIGCD